MATVKSYDFLNRLTAMTSAAGGSNVVVFNYGNNPANQRTAITNLDNSRWVYQYDTLGQVISGKKYWSDGTPACPVRYYEPVQLCLRAAQRFGCQFLRGVDGRFEATASGTPRRLRALHKSASAIGTDLL